MILNAARIFAAEYEPVISTDGRRRSPRAAVSLDARIGRGGLDRTLCKVTDLSRHGARLQTYSALRKGALIWLTLPGHGQRATRIMWADDFEAGCLFEDPLSQAEFDALTEE